MNRIYTKFQCYAWDCSKRFLLFFQDIIRDQNIEVCRRLGRVVKRVILRQWHTKLMRQYQELKQN